MSLTATPAPVRWYLPWRWRWWTWLLLSPLLFTAYAITGSLVFYILDRYGIFGPVRTACYVFYWPADWAKHNFPYGTAIRYWIADVWHWLLDNPQ